MSSPRPRVLLVYTTPIKPDAFFGFLLPPLGLERLAACLEPLAEVKILDLRFEGESWLETASAFAPDFIGVNVKTTMYATHSYRMADRLRARLPQARLILGGLHASSVPEEALTHGDAVVIGEGEQAMVEIVQGKPLPEIQGLACRDAAGKPIFTPVRPLRENLDELPPPARHLRPSHYRYMAAKLIPMDLLETSRGCTLFCPFCSPAITHKGHWRGHSTEYVLAEVKRLWDRGVKYVMLTDDHFSADLDRAKKISELISAAGIRMAFFCFLRPFLGRMDVKKAMVQAGFIMLSYGAESPDAEQLKRFGKGFADPVNFIRDVNREWHEAGVRYIGNSFVFGDPRETRANIEMLGDYARELDPTYIEPLYSQPFPGTRYRAELEKEGRLLPHTWDEVTEARMLVRHPEYDEEGLRAARVRMWLRFFSPRKVVGAFRVPLYFMQEVGLPVRTVLKYMKACDYSVFGCILEEKFYLHRKRSMVREYLTEHINTFSERERDMTPFTDLFTSAIGLGWLKRLMGTRTLALEIVEGERVVTRFGLALRDGKVDRMWAGDAPTGYCASVSGPTSGGVRFDRVFRLRLDDAVELLCAHEMGKFAALTRTVLRNLIACLLGRR